jgi:hypothetical protein
MKGKRAHSTLQSLINGFACYPGAKAILRPESGQVKPDFENDFSEDVVAVRNIRHRTAASACATCARESSSCKRANKSPAFLLLMVLDKR